MSSFSRVKSGGWDLPQPEVKRWDGTYLLWSCTTKNKRIGSRKKCNWIPHDSQDSQKINENCLLNDWKMQLLAAQQVCTNFKVVAIVFFKFFMEKYRCTGFILPSHLKKWHSFWLQMYSISKNISKLEIIHRYLGPPVCSNYIWMRIVVV